MKVLVTSLDFSKPIRDNPFDTIFGNPVRAWAFFHYWNKWGLDTTFLVPNKCKISKEVLEKYNNKFEYSDESFDVEIVKKYDLVVITSTRIQSFSSLPKAKTIADSGIPIQLAICYDDVENLDNISQELISNSISIGFCSPYFIKDPFQRFRNKYQYRITSGVSLNSTDKLKLLDPQKNDRPNIISSTYIRYKWYADLIRDAAKELPGCDFLITTRQATNWDNNMKYNLSSLSPKEREIYVLKMFCDENGYTPSNIKYFFTDPENEFNFFANANIGLDMCWHRGWKFDNSKVNHYLAYGIPVISTLPSLSFRHINLINSHGICLNWKPNKDQFIDAIKYLMIDKFQEKSNRIKAAEKSQALFSWEVVALEGFEAVLGSLGKDQSEIWTFIRNLGLNELNKSLPN